jgi:hypothetical protein
MPKRKLAPSEPAISAREIRYYMLRILASSHDLWQECPHPRCRRARCCVDNSFVCLDTPLLITAETFLDWYG